MRLHPIRLALLAAALSACRQEVQKEYRVEVQGEEGSVILPLGYSDKEVDIQMAPGAKHVASVYERDVGATADFTTFVRLRIRHEGIHPGPDLAGDADNVLILEGIQKLGLEWEGPGVLVIRHPADAAVHKKLEVWKELRLRYEAAP